MATLQHALRPAFPEQHGRTPGTRKYKQRVDPLSPPRDHTSQEFVQAPL